MAFNWNSDYLNLSRMIRDGQDPRDKEPMIDHAQDLLDIMPMESIDTQSTTSSIESSTPTSDNNDTLMANIDALASIQGVSSLLHRTNISEPMYQASTPFNTPACRRPAPLPFSVIQRPSHSDLWRSTLVEPADFSVFNPCSKLPELHTQQQETVFDPDNAEVDDSYCVLCKKNGEQREFYVSHVLKDSRGKVVCPILRKYVCPTCGASGDNAHTIRHCPKASKQ